MKMPCDLKVEMLYGVFTLIPSLAVNWLFSHGGLQMRPFKTGKAHEPGFFAEAVDGQFRNLASSA